MPNHIPLKNTPEQFGLMARGLHWIIALLILGLLIVGYYMGTMGFGPDKIQVYGLHKAIGITVLGFGIIRIIWRIISAPPAALATHERWERILAKTMHAVLYICMIGMPLSGWVMSSAGNHPISFFGLFQLPDIVGEDKDLKEVAEEVHEIMATGLIGVILLHVAGAVKHQIVDKDSTMRRMGGNLVLALFGLAMLGAAVFFMTSEGEHDGPKEKSEHLQTSSVETDHDEDGMAEESESKAWAIDVPASRIGFTFNQSGKDVSAQFTDWRGQIVFDEDHLETSHATIHIQAASIQTGSEERDEQARSGDWFAASQFPEITFTSTRFSETEKGQYIADGILDVRGVKKDIRFPFTLETESLGQGRKKAVMDATLSLSRLDFGVGQGQWQSTRDIGADIAVELHVEADELDD